MQLSEEVRGPAWLSLPRERLGQARDLPLGCDHAGLSPARIIYTMAIVVFCGPLGGRREKEGKGPGWHQQADLGGPPPRVLRPGVLSGEERALELESRPCLVLA